MRLIFSDMDGTFLADDKTIPEGNLRALDLIAQAGDRFVPCTGRLFDGIPACVLERPDVEYAISANGACVSSKTAQGWQLVHAHEMAPETMLAVAHAVESMDLLVEFFTEHAIFITSDRFAAFDRYFKDTPFYEYAQRTRRPYPGTVEELVAACAPIFRMNLRTYTPPMPARPSAPSRASGACTSRPRSRARSTSPSPGRPRGRRRHGSPSVWASHSPMPSRSATPTTTARSSPQWATGWP